MTRETRIGLLVGLVFIVMFGLVLTELTGTNSSTAPRIVDEPPTLSWAPAIEEISPAVVPDEPVLAEGRDTSLTDGQGAAPGEATLVASYSPRPFPADGLIGGGEALGADEPGSFPPLGADVAQTSSQAPAPVVRTYTVQPRDSLIKIARRFYGSGNEQRYRRILQANRDAIKDESRLLVGQVLLIPPLEGTAEGLARADGVVEADLATLRGILLQAEEVRPSKRRYVVRRGDNLTKIARKTLQDGSRAGAMKIFNANRDKLKDPNHLPVGLRLEIPI